MSDDEDAVVYTKKTKSLHYGSLEEQEKKRLASGQDSVQTGIQAGNINISAGTVSLFFLPLCVFYLSNCTVCNVTERTEVAGHRTRYSTDEQHYLIRYCANVCLPFQLFSLYRYIKVCNIKMKNEKQ